MKTTGIIVTKKKPLQFNGTKWHVKHAKRNSVQRNKRLKTVLSAQKPETLAFKGEKYQRQPLSWETINTFLCETLYLNK